jgi:O-antigen/teichoic acid export membrane protein
MTDTIAAAPKPDTVGRRVTMDSIWILAGYAVTALTGFVFWVVAARIIPPAELGIDTAMYSIFTAAAQVAASGIGDALLVMLPGLTRYRKPLYLVGISAAFVVAAIAGVIAGFLVVTFVHPAAPAWAVVLGVTLAAVIWTMFVIKDPILTSLGGARLNLTMNGPVNIIKLALIPVLVAVVGASGNPVLIAAVLPAAGALVVAYGFLIPRRMRSFVPVAGSTSETRTADIGVPLVVDTAADPLPAAADPVVALVPPAATDAPVAPSVTTDAAAAGPVSAPPAGRHESPPFRRFTAFATRMGIANGLYLGGALILPFLVTSIAGSEQGALFALCFQIGQVVDLVVIAIGTSLATHVSTNRHLAGAIAFRTWLAVVGIVGVGVVALIALAPFILGLLGSFYVESGGVAILGTLAVGSLLRTAYEVWGSMQRSLHRTKAVLVVSAASSVVLFPLAIVGITMGGALGGAVALATMTFGLFLVGLVGLLRARRAPAASFDLETA